VLSSNTHPSHAQDEKAQKKARTQKNETRGGHLDIFPRIPVKHELFQPLCWVHGGLDFSDANDEFLECFDKTGSGAQ